ALLVRRLAGWGAASFLPIAWWGVSVFGVRVLFWWGPSFHAYAAVLFTLLCLLFFVRWHQDGRGADRWISVGAFAAALLVQERPLLIPLYLVMLRYIVLPPRPFRFRIVLGELRRDLRIWVPYAFLFGAALFNLLLFYSENKGRPSLGTI